MLLRVVLYIIAFLLIIHVIRSVVRTRSFTVADALAALAIVVTFLLAPNVDMSSGPPVNSTPTTAVDQLTSAATVPTATQTIMAPTAISTPDITPTTPSAEFDLNMWYRLTTEYLGTGRALDIRGDSDKSLFMAETGDYTGQYWKLTPLGDGYYRLTSKYLGPDRALDIRGDSDKSLFMAETGDYTGQHWKLTPIEPIQ